jgi:uncharacterized protein
LRAWASSAGTFRFSAGSVLDRDLAFPDTQAEQGEGMRIEPSDAATGPTLRPVAVAERVHTLDALRGIAILGILFVNIEYLKGSGMYRGMAGAATEPTGVDATVSFAVGWLVAGKFLSSFAILFGIGAALLLDRPSGTFEERRRLVRRRYALLVPLGLAHMVLLSPVDILLVYGIGGLFLVRFAHLLGHRLWIWAASLLAGSAAALAALAWWMTPRDASPGDPLEVAMQGFLMERADLAVEAFRGGTYADVVVANAWQAAFVQFGQLLTLPWILGLFLLGLAIARTLRLDALSSHRRELRVAAAVGLGIGLPVNLLLGQHGAMAMSSALSPTAGSPASAALSSATLSLGAPLLAVGYLASVALLAQRGSIAAPLARVGRVALSAYMLQSVLALVLFAGFGRYERFTIAEALLVALAIGGLVIVAASLWLRAFRIGPVEWVWRTATYRQRQRLR